LEQTKDWLHKTIADGKDQEKSGLNLPLRSDGSPYTIDGLAEDQKESLGVVLTALKSYCDRPTGEEQGVLRLTVSGVAGSGKSTWINTLVTTVRQMFDDDEVISVFAPTGSAAYNAGGETLHRGFLLPFDIKTEEMDPQKVKKLLAKFQKTLILVIDERSMMDAQTLGLIRLFMQQCAHLGTHKDHPWGGIPIVIVVGDDFQLPSILYGAIYSLPGVELKKDKATTPAAQIKARTDGFEEFRELGKNVMYLLGEKRVNEDQEQFKRILNAVRCENNNSELCESDIQRLLELDVNHSAIPKADRAKIEEEALYIFANKDPRDTMNDIKLKQANVKGNPVARIVSSTISNKGNRVVNQNHYDAERTPRRTLLCESARVSLNGWNAEPSKGLYHGSIGMVKDIVYEDGESPNLGDMPAYVLVEFQQYCGPPMLVDMSKVIPVTPREQRCKFGCCCRTYLPLALAYGKTAHTFQGATVGPVQQGRPENPIKVIIVDPGNRGFEGNNVGLLYTLLSRATTIGTPSERGSSAIYFTGDNYNRTRITNLTTGSSGTYVKAKLRNAWVAYLRSNAGANRCLQPQERLDLFNWASCAKFTPDMLKEVLRTV
jgi:hypothetical protein